MLVGYDRLFYYNLQIKAATVRHILYRYYWSEEEGKLIIRKFLQAIYNSTDCIKRAIIIE